MIRSARLYITGSITLWVNGLFYRVLVYHGTIRYVGCSSQKRPQEHWLSDTTLVQYKQSMSRTNVTMIGGSIACFQYCSRYHCCNRHYWSYTVEQSPYPICPMERSCWVFSCLIPSWRMVILCQPTMTKVLNDIVQHNRWRYLGLLLWS